jgi:hypothetical protein
MGLMVISFWYLPHPYWIRQPCLVEDGHGRLGTSGQEGRRRDIASGAARCHTIGNDCLICRDVGRGHMLDGDLLLPSTAVMVEPLSQQHHRLRCLIRKLQVFDWHRKMFVQLSENESNDGVDLIFAQKRRSTVAVSPFAGKLCRLARTPAQAQRVPALLRNTPAVASSPT